MLQELLSFNPGNLSWFEAGMLICFAASWPAAIWKTYKSKNPGGKSILFALLVIIGYICGGLHKILYKPDFIFWLYMLNGAMVATDLILVLHYRRRRAMAGIQPSAPPATERT